MASVITSARTSSASIFDMFGHTANAASQLVKTTAKTIDALDAKVTDMTSSVIYNSKGNSVEKIEDIAHEITVRSLEREETIHRIRKPGEDFDYTATYDTIKARVLAAIKEE
jgi:hypothetical protein